MSDVLLSVDEWREVERAARLFSACNVLMTGQQGCYFWLPGVEAPGVQCWWVEYGDPITLRPVGRK